MSRGGKGGRRVRERDVLRGQAMRGNIRESTAAEVGESAEILFGSCADVVV